MPVATAGDYQAQQFGTRAYCFLSFTSRLDEMTKEKVNVKQHQKYAIPLIRFIWQENDANTLPQCEKDMSISPRSTCKSRKLEPDDLETQLASS